MHPNIEKNLHKFKDSFQKTTLIYKCLRSRWQTHPLMLSRTLSYVNKHRNRRVRRRTTSIDKIASKLARKPVNNTTPTNVTANNNTTTKQNASKKEQLTIAKPQSSDVFRDTYNGYQYINNLDKVIRVRCFLKWICDNPDKTTQKTVTYGFVCPWCEKNCWRLVTLMAHFRHWHPRANYLLTWDDVELSIPLIEITINPAYDGSYCGFKFPGHDQRRDFKFTSKSPQKRVPTLIHTFFRPKKHKISAILDTRPEQESDMLADNEEADIDVCSGRLYYHTSTCLPVKPNEGDIDSEADTDPEWLMERTQLMIDEFTDVNEGEKELLKLWNLHMMNNSKYRADHMIRQACLDFVQQKGIIILSKNIVKNFTLHLANLYDYGLISSKDMLECIRGLKSKKRLPQQQHQNQQQIITSPTRAASKVKQEQRNEHCLHSPPAKRALLNSHCN